MEKDLELLNYPMCILNQDVNIGKLSGETDSVLIEFR